jgi:hypothetical protein
VNGKLTIENKTFGREDEICLFFHFDFVFVFVMYFIMIFFGEGEESTGLCEISFQFF